MIRNLLKLKTLRKAKIFDIFYSLRINNSLNDGTLNKI